MTNRQISLDNIDRVENLAFVPLEKKYLKAHTAATALAWLGLMLLPLFILLADELDGRNLIVICAEAVLLAAGLVNLAILPNGIVFPKTVTIPFCKVQQVSVRQNPVSRMFGLYAVDVVSGAQMLAETVIPGLTREKAEEIKSLLIERTRNENR